nr:hypothetical protein Iba_chr13dCG9660 [Ipomoea batatas]
MLCNVTGSGKPEQRPYKIASGGVEEATRNMMLTVMTHGSAKADRYIEVKLAQKHKKSQTTLVDSGGDEALTQKTDNDNGRWCGAGSPLPLSLPGIALDSFFFYRLGFSI